MFIGPAGAVGDAAGVENMSKPLSMPALFILSLLLLLVAVEAGCIDNEERKSSSSSTTGGDDAVLDAFGEVAEAKPCQVESMHTQGKKTRQEGTAHSSSS